MKFAGQRAQARGAGDAEFVTLLQRQPPSRRQLAPPRGRRPHFGAIRGPSRPSPMSALHPVGNGGFSAGTPGWSYCLGRDYVLRG
jgi:hypothetical protein